MKQRFLAFFAIFTLVFSYSSHIFSAEEVLEGVTKAVEETAERSGVEVSEEAAERVAQQATEQIAEETAEVTQGLEGQELKDAESAVETTMEASVKDEIKSMAEGDLKKNLQKLAEGKESAFSSLGEDASADFMKQSPEDFADSLEGSGLSPDAVASLKEQFADAQEVLSRSVKKVEGEVPGDLASVGGQAADEAGGKELSQADKDAIDSMRKDLGENSVSQRYIKTAVKDVDGVTSRATKAAEGLSKDMDVINASNVANDTLEKEIAQGDRKLVGKSVRGIAEDSLKTFRKMDKAAQERVMKAAGADSKEAFEKMLQGKGGVEGFKSAVYEVGAEDAMSSLDRVEGNVGERGMKGAVSAARKGMQEAFSEAKEGVLSSEEGASEKALEKMGQDVEAVGKDFSKAADEQLGDLDGKAKDLLNGIKEKGGYKWVSKVKAGFATGEESMASKWDRMTEDITGEGVKKGVKKVGEYGLKGVKGIGKSLFGIGHTLFQAVLFMIPNIFESAFLAQKQRNALLKTYATPVKFGNVVLQMPDSAFDMDEPSQSKFIYFGIPVADVGDTLSAQAAARYPGVTGPDANNKISSGIHDDLAKMFTAGIAQSDIPKRYNISDAAMQKLPLYVAYNDKSWGDWGQVSIPDPQFTDMMINLNTGFIFFADGQSEETPAAPLIGFGKTKSVEAFLSKKLGELETAGSAYSYTEYVNTMESAKSESMNPAIVRLFDCGCLDAAGKEDLSNLSTRCKVQGQPACLLTSTLNDMGSGVSLDSHGRSMVQATKQAEPKSVAPASSSSYRAGVLGRLQDTSSALGQSLSDQQMTSDASSNTAVLEADSYDMSEKSLIDQSMSVEDVKKGLAGTLDTTPKSVIDEVKRGALGPIIPIQGYGNKFMDYLDNFPGGANIALSNPGAFTISLNSSGLSLGDSTSSDTSSTAAQIVGAPVDNYAAQGIYVYQCSNTPFARLLKMQSHASKNVTAASIAANYYMHDYIVFFDENINNVPLVVPVEDKSDYNFCQLGFNPAIKYYTSLIAADLPQMKVHPWDEVEAEIERVATSYKHAKTEADKADYNQLYNELMNYRKQYAASQYPRSFTPLYQLNLDMFGFPKLAYHQSVDQTVQSIISQLKQHPDLGQQFVDVKNALTNLFYHGPFGPLKLVAVPDSMQTTVQNIKVVFYQNYNAYPIPQNEHGLNEKGEADPTLYNDILLPLAKVLQPDGSYKTQTAVLPGAVDEYRGLVSDITYTVQADGSLQATDFSNSPFSITDLAGSAATKDDVIWHFDSSKAQTYHWLSFIESIGGSGYQAPTDLVSEVQTRRAAWAQFITTAMKTKFSKKELSGVPWADTGMTLQIVDQKSLTKGLYLYTCSPSPSSLANDYFVLTNSSSPQASSASLGTLSALDATDSTNMLSVVSGQLYDSFGDPVQDSSGNNVSVDASVLLQTLQVKSDVGSGVYSKIMAGQTQLSKEANTPVYPVSEFDTLQLGMYHADIESGTYVYFNTSGMGSSSTQEPQDYYVTVDMQASPVKWQQQVSASTKNMMSLVSGQVIERGRGATTKLKSDKIDGVIASLSKNWRPELTQKVKALRAAADKAMVAEQKEQDELDQEEQNLTSGSISWTQAQVQNYIANIKSAPYLPSPHGALKQDPASKQYILVSPASSDGNSFMYTFFNVPNTYKDARGKSIQVGVMYDQQGNQMRLIEGVQLAALRNQYGVAVDASGNQSLGATNLQPPLIMADDDKNLVPGKSGVAMICSTSDKFPVMGVASPVSYQGGKYYFYYNAIMKAYYVLEVKNGVSRYMSMAGGNIYNLDGSCAIAEHPVALRQDAAGKTVEDDMLLPYLNADSYTQCIMKNPQANGRFMDFVNIESGFKGDLKFKSTGMLAALNSMMANDSPFNSINVVQMPRPDKMPPMPALEMATQYNVYWDNANPVVYKVDAKYQWQDLMLLPIDMVTRKPMSPVPGSSYQSARLVVKQGVMEYLMFNGLMYKVASKVSEGAYKMSPVVSATASDVTVSMNRDEKTNVAYLQVVADAVSYNYQYVFDKLDAQELASYRHNIWKADTVADVHARVLLAKDLPVDGSGQLQLAQVGLKSVANLPTTLSVQTAFSSNLSRIVHDTVNDRYLAQVYSKSGGQGSGPFYDYFDQDGYVDLATGILFDDQGIPVLYTLKLDDLLALLNKLNVAIVHQNGKAVLSYRSARAIAQEEADLKEGLADEQNLNNAADAKGAKPQVAQ